MRLIIDIEQGALGARIECLDDDVVPSETEMAGRLARALAAVVDAGPKDDPAPASNGVPTPTIADEITAAKAAGRRAGRQASSRSDGASAPVQAWDDQDSKRRELQRLRDEEELSLADAAQRVGVSLAQARAWDGEPS